MSYSSSDDPPRPPRAAPEILPPERPGDRRREPPPVWTASRGFVFTAPGPVGVALMLLGLGALAVVGVVLFIGLFLLWVPIVGALVAGFVLAALLRRR